MAMPNRKWAKEVTRGFAGEIITLREEQGMSMNELAVRAGLARSYITYLEQGMRYPSYETFCVVSAALELCPDVLHRRIQFKIDLKPKFRMRRK